MTDSTKAGLREDERPASKILCGLEEAAAWAHGEGKARAHIPGQPPRMMSRAEFEAAIAAREEDRARASGIPVNDEETQALIECEMEMTSQLFLAKTNSSWKGGKT